VARASLSALLLLTISCSRTPQSPTIQRLAILRFENLSGDPSLDWIGRALPEIVTSELTRSTSLYAIPSSRLHSLNQALGVRPIAAPGISAEAPLAQTLNATRIGYGYYTVEGGLLQAHLTIEDPRTQHMVQLLTSATSHLPDVISVANSLARGIWPEAQPWPVRNPEALRSYAIALESTDAAAMERDGEAAVAADPDFSRPYLLLAELKARRQDGAGAQSVLQSALGRPRIDAAGRAEIEAVAAGLGNDAAARERALAEQVRLAPNNAAAWRSLAEIHVARHRFPEAGQDYERALAIEPEDPILWNEAGYAAAWAGNLPAAMSHLRRYQALRPNDANPLDSMGDVNLMLGHLAEAERFYLDAVQKDPGFLNGAGTYKAAMAHLMTGDVAGADAIFRQRFPQPNPEWLWVTGRRNEAYALLERQIEGAVSSPNRSGAYAQLAFWSLWLDNPAAAAAMARKAAETAVPASTSLVALARFLTQPTATADQWSARAAEGFRNSAARDVALAYALLLDRHFAEAVPVLRRTYETSPPSDSGLPIELAWALIESGNAKDAAPLLRLNPVPGPNGPSPFLSFYFPRLFELRARLNDADAAANRRVYEALTNPPR
jgi:tetratricopeptide (TPR) repeat protein